MAYTRSEDGGDTWTDLVQVDTVMTISSVIAASPVSGKVALAYSKTQDTTTQWNNDIVYFASSDGTDWDWDNGMVNITNYLTDNDSAWAYTDLDVIIDYDDYVHVLWSDQWVTDEGIYYRTDLKHYSENSGEITTILHHPDSLWIDISGAWNRSISKMNLGVSESGGVFATWTQFDTSDVSAGGYGNGDIYMSYSYDDGATWATPINMTDSQTPGCYPGQCESDHWSTLADVVNDSLHVIYIEDKDAGGIPQTEGSATENPVKYMTYPTPGPSGINDVDNRPLNFSLNQNYPNPFNASTNISFSLQETSPVLIEVFDLTGAKVGVIANQVFTAGDHNVTWNGGDVASGVYYYKLTSGSETDTKQMVLIK
jgi:hypothetical protein